MSLSGAFPIFDGHNDVLWRLYKKQTGNVEALFIDGETPGQLDLPRAFKGGFGGGFFAVFCPTEEADDIDSEMDKEAYDIVLPDQLPHTEALNITLTMAAILFRIERASKGRFKVCRSAAEIRHCLSSNTLAAVFHIEGAEAIDREFNSLQVLYESGLRSLGPVWSRPNIFAHGVPFRYPGTPDTGPGLTDTGKALVKACNQLKIAVDLSHLNERGFWDVAKLSDAPLIATHSNAHRLCPHSRNLTDRQLDAIRETSGMVGVNFATILLRDDSLENPGRNRSSGLDAILRHVDYLINRLGIDGVGFGSDFDGAQVPGEIGDVAGLDTLRQAMRANGFDDETMKKLCSDNWINVLERTWGQ